MVANVTRETFQDCTGYECFYNSIHVEDYDDKMPLLQAMLFVKEVFAVWNMSKPGARMNAIIRADACSVVVKFHVDRPEEKWLSDDIEGYESAILSIDSAEDLNFPTERTL